jgi:tyrosyl-tRNA synthetase
MALAREIVAIYHGAAAVAPAEAHFQAVFQKNALPDEMPTIRVPDAPLLTEFLAAHKLAASKSEARRLIEQGGVKLAGQPVTEVMARLEFAGEAVIQVGKRKFVRVIRG